MSKPIAPEFRRWHSAIAAWWRIRIQECPVSVQQHEIADAKHVVDSTGRIRDQQVANSQLLQHSDRERRAFQRMPFVEMNAALQQQKCHPVRHCQESIGRHAHTRLGRADGEHGRKGPRLRHDPLPFFRQPPIRTPGSLRSQTLTKHHCAPLVSRMNSAACCSSVVLI